MSRAGAGLLLRVDSRAVEKSLQGITRPSPTPPDTPPRVDTRRASLTTVTRTWSSTTRSWSPGGLGSGGAV